MTDQVQDKSTNYFSKALLIVDDLLVDPYDFRLYMKLKRIAGQNDRCFPSRKTLAKECGMSESTIDRRLKNLAMPREELGGSPLIVIKERVDKETESQKSNLYILPDLELYNVQKYFRGYSQRRGGVVTETNKEDTIEEDSKTTTSDDELLGNSEQLKEDSSSSPKGEKFNLLKDLPINDETKGRLSRFSVEVLKEAIAETKKKRSVAKFGGYLFTAAKRISEEGCQKTVKPKDDEKLLSEAKKCLQEKIESVGLPSSFEIHFEDRHYVVLEDKIALDVIGYLQDDAEDRTNKILNIFKECNDENRNAK